MKVDPDLVRNILIEIEKLPPEPQPLNRVTKWYQIILEGRSKEEISEHVRLMVEAGFLQALKHPEQGGIFWYPIRMTWHGHQYLDSVRADTVYAKTKEIASRAFGTVTVETIKVAIPLALQALLKSHGFVP